MINPYVVLNIKETSTDQEIKEALKKQVNLYCGVDENKKDSSGNYLKETFYEAANMLLDKEKRKQVDIELGNNRCDYSLRVIDNANKNKYGERVTYIDNEYMKLKVKFSKKKIFSKKIKTNNLFILIGEDNSVMIAKEKKFYEGKTKFQLYDIFTDQWLTYLVKDGKCPWCKGKEFKVLGGINTVALIGAKFIPLNIIDSNGKVSKSDLLVLKRAIEEYYQNHQEEVIKIFKKTKDEKCDIKTESTL